MSNHEGYADRTAEKAISNVMREQKKKGKRKEESMETRDAPKLKKVRRLDSIRLDAGDRTYFTEEGYLVDHPILTSCGIFEYTNPDGSIRRELRLPEHVFDEKSLASYKGKPIIITHEAGVVNKANVDREQIGTILTTGYQDGEDVRAEIIIHNTDAMKDCGLKELSLGYNLDLVEKPGTWNGEPYDAIQTNIIINHLALVANARAGGQARLNIDGSDEPELKGGKATMANVTQATNKDSGAMSPEELKKQIEAYKARKAERASAGNAEETPAADEGAEVTPTAEESLPVEEEEATDGVEEETPAEENPGKTPEEIAQLVKDRRDRRDAEEDPEDVEGCMGVIAQQDEDIDQLLACLETILAEKAANADAKPEEVPAEEENADGSDDQSKSLNADSADEIFRQRLAICRIGDKLHMDGLESKSILEGKKAIIAKVLPSMRLDGKSTAYIDAAFDMAVNEANKRKTVAYQKQQMAQNKPEQRNDSAQNVSMAQSARARMINRTTEGGNK